ncbi:unnamed protein product [Caenorhabditis nigoni]
MRPQPVLDIRNDKADLILNDCSIDDFKDEFPDLGPRFALLRWSKKESDESVLYKTLLIFCCPEVGNPEVEILYNASLNMVINECHVSKWIRVSEAEDIDQDLLDSNS